MRGLGKPTVPLLDNVFGPNLNNLQNALTKATQRQSLLMNNLANVNVPGYKRKDMDFHVTLQQEMGTLDQRVKAMKDQQAQTLAQGSSTRQDGNSVDLEREVQSIAETELYFNAVTDLTAGYFSNLKNVIREGK